jgi:hypothetical protein
MRRRDMFWYTTGMAIGRVMVAGRALVGQVRQATGTPAATAGPVSAAKRHAAPGSGHGTIS